MKGTKFMVIKFKELLKTSIFAVLGVIIIVAIIFFLVPENNESALYNPGTYTATIMLEGNPLHINVSVNSTSIKDISLTHTDEAIPVFYPLFETAGNTLKEEILAKQSLDVTIPENASLTSNVILAAIADNLSRAKAY